MLLGRAHDLETLTALVRGPGEQPGSFRVVRVEGEVGVGKSALLSAVVAQLSEPVLLSHGEVSPGASPLSSQRTIIEELLRVPLETALSEETTRTLAARCAEAMGATETVWVVDDAQWLSPAAEEFLSALILSPRVPSLTLVLAHRTGSSPDALLSAARRRGAVQDDFIVKPLSPLAVDELLNDLPPPLAASVLDYAEGNPLFIHIALAALRRHPEASTLEEALQFEGSNQSAILSTAIAREIASLPAEAREVLDIAAVQSDLWNLERGFDLYSGGRDRYEAALALLKQQGLLSGDRREGLHPAVRLSAYQHISPERRIELHRAAADLSHADALTRASHLAQLGSALTEDEASHVIAGATLMLAFEPASTVRLLSSLEEPHRTYDVEKLAARAAIMSGDPHDAIRRLGRFTACFYRDPELLILFADALRMIGEVPEARSLIQGFPDPDVPLLRRELIDVTALIDGAAPSSYVERLRTHPEQEHQHIADIYDTMGLLANGEVASARQRFAVIPGWIGSLGQESLRDCIHAVSCAAWCAYILDDHTDALSIAERGAAIAQRYGRSSALPNLTTARAFALFQLGRMAEAEDAALHSLSVSELFGSADLATMSRAVFLLCALPLADEELIADRYRELVDAALPKMDWWRLAVMAIRIRASAIIGEPEPYECLLNAPHDALTGMRHADIALAALQNDNDDLAGQYVRQGLALAREQGADAQEALLYLAQAMIALKSNRAKRLRTAVEGLQKAREVFLSRAMGVQLARTDGLIAAAREQLRRANSPWAKLTPREREVAEHLTQGHTNQQIATLLDISIRTVEDHAAQVLKKLETPSRTRAAVLLSRSDPST